MDISIPEFAYNFWSGTISEEMPSGFVMAGTEISFYVAFIEHSRKRKSCALRGLRIGSLRILEEDDVRVGLMRKMLGVWKTPAFQSDG